MTGNNDGRTWTEGQNDGRACKSIGLGTGESMDKAT